MRLNYNLERRRTLTFLLVFVMLACVMWTTSSFAALTAGRTGTSTWVYMGAGKDGKAYLSTNTGNRQPKYTVKAGGTSYVGYCINPDKGWGSGTRMTSRSFDSSKTIAALSDAKKELLSYVLLYGYNSGKSAPYGNVNDYYAATQVLVWQVIEGNAVMNKEGTWTKSSTTDKKYGLIRNHTYGVRCYNHIRQEISKHVKCPSFACTTEKNARVNKMKYNYRTERFTSVLNDSSGGNYLKMAGGSSDLEMNRSGAAYTFSAAEAGSYSAVLKNDRNYGTGQSAMVFDSSSSGTQSVALGATDKKVFYAAFETEKKGKGNIVKVDEKGERLSGFTFRITCAQNGYDNTHTTDVKGEIDVELFPGEYTVTEVLTPEQLKANWKKAEPQTLIIKEGETSSITVENVLDKSAALKIIKQNCDGGPCGGFRFRIEGLLDDAGTLTEEEVIKRADPIYSDEDYSVREWKISNSHVLNQINSDALEGKKGAYVIRLEAVADLKADKSESTENTEAATETGKAEKAGAESDSGEDNEENDDGSSAEKRAETLELKLDVTVRLRETGGDKEDPVKKNQNGIVSYDFTWNGSATGFSKVYETDDEGVIAIDSIPYGSYTISEEMTDAQKARYKSPPSQHVLINENTHNDIKPFVFENIARETHIKIRKTSLDGVVADIPFCIKGSTAWGEEINVTAVTDGEGNADFGFIPAGKYTAEECSQDLQKYEPVQPKEFTVTGDEDGCLIELEFENVRKSDLLISKEDGTTGNELAGARLRLTDKATGEIIREWTSGSEPYLISGLKYGQVVVLQELLPPVIVTDEKRGFMNSEGEYVTGFSQAKEIEIVVGSEEKVTMVDEPTQVVISKKVENTGRFLAGASLSIVDAESGNVIHQWISTEEPHVVEGLIEGKKYILREEKAPEGYLAAKEMYFVPGKNTEIVMMDKPSGTDSAQTGDNRWIAAVLSGILCIMSIAGAIAVFAARPKE